MRWNASCARYQCMINFARKLRISALSWCESFFKAKVLWKMKIRRMERTFEAFWRQVFNNKFYYTKWMCDETHPAQDISAWLIFLESSESHLYRIVYWLEKVFLASVKFAVQALDDWETDYPNVISLMFFAHWDGTHRSLSRDVGKRLLRVMVARNPVVTGITRYSFPH